MFEEERKFEVGPAFALPDPPLPDLKMVPRPAITLRATYFDTPDLRLARAGASLRYRRGDDEPWTVKLPTGVPGVRREISAPGKPGEPPAELARLVTAWRRGAPLAPVVTVRTARHPYDLVGDGGRVLAELVDDEVSVLDGKKVTARFREIEVERRGGGHGFLEQVAAALVAAGATEGEFTPKHVRALGAPASAPPDLVPAPAKPPKKATTAEVVVAAIRRDIGRIIAHDPLVRLRAEVGDGDTAVHQMRVGCRRLRSDLRTFKVFLAADWADDLRAELSWLADALGGARDAEVLRARLRHTAAADPLAPPDAADVARLDELLAARQSQALDELDAALDSERYLTLLDHLVAAAATPHVADEAQAPAAVALPGIVAKPWRRLVREATALDPLAPDDVWHAVRIHAKRARYAVEAVASVVGGAATALGRALAGVQEHLGEHQDAVIASEAWLSLAADEPDRLGVTAGRLFERERASVRAARSAFPAAWHAATRKPLTGWLP